MEKVLKLAENIENHFLVRVVRRGMMILMPIVLIASIAQAILVFPIEGFRMFTQEIFGGGVYMILTHIKEFCFAHFSVILSVCIGVSYSMEKREPVESMVLTPVLSVAAFMLISRPDLGSIEAKMGVQGCFLAMLVSLIASAFYVNLVNSSLAKPWKNTGNNDIMYSGVTRALVPCIIVMATAAFASFIFSDLIGIKNLNEWITTYINKFMNLFESEFAKSVVSTFFISFFWFLGMHGNNVFDNFMQAHTAVGEDIIFSKTFFDAFVNMGGCGTALCIILAILFFAKFRRTRNLAGTALFPVAFNTNEILTFGMPIVWNPMMFIPFILVPIECAIVSFTAIKMGIVSPIVASVDWTVPVFASGYIATGGSMSGISLQLFNLLIGTLTYVPFIKLNEQAQTMTIKKQAKEITDELRRAELNGTEVDFINRTDTCGAIARMLMEDLAEAVMKRELYLVYQPQFEADGTCIGAEALMRWNHPIAGKMYPPLIVYLAQQGGILPLIENQIFDMACSAIKITEQNCGKKFKISANITAKSLAWDGLVSCIDASVMRYKVNPHKLWIEITEQDVLSKEAAVIEKITTLKKHGHSFLIDDFGMGKTSILYLQTKLFDGVKLDGSLVTSMFVNETNREIVASVINLTKKLGIKAIAEYIETKKHCEVLDEMGCDWYQGYYFSKPVGLSGFIDCLIRTGKEPDGDDYDYLS